MIFSKSRLVSLVAVASCVAASGWARAEGGLKTPETSRLFVRHVDPETEVESWLLKPKSFAWNQQSLYFTAKSMTDDGRFLVFDYSGDEFHGAPPRKRKAIVDFLKDEIVPLPGTDGSIPFFDPKTAKMLYTANEGIWMHDLRRDPTNRTLVCPWPKEFLALGKRRGFLATHLTLSQDRMKAFVDTRFDDTFYHGCLNLATGAWEHWGSTPFFLNHGQLCPCDDNLALGAWEVDWVDAKGEHHPIPYVGPDKRYPRMWYLWPGDRRQMIDPGPGMNYATHEMWDEDGRGHYWNNWSGLWHYDRFLERTERISPFPAGHSTVTRDMRYVVSDFPVGVGYWRGQPWNVVFYDRQTGGAAFVHSRNEPLCPPSPGSRLHPDAHPAFVCGERYVVTTVNNADGHMDLCLTPTAPLKARCAKPTALGGPLPPEAHPMSVGERIGQQYFRVPTRELAAHGDPRTVRDLVLEYARLTGNHRLPIDLNERGNQPAGEGPAPDPEAVEALRLVRAVLGGEAAKADAARAAWVRVAAVESPKDWTTVMTAANLLIAADRPAKVRPLTAQTPNPDETVTLTRKERRAFLSKGPEERRRLFLDKAWRASAVRAGSLPDPVTFRWLGAVPKDGFALTIRRIDRERPVLETRVRGNSYEMWNLEIGRTYEWTVSDGTRTVTNRFRTDGNAPRDLRVPGVPNFRDLGGWIGLDGRRVRQGMVYRSQGLNNNADFFLTTKETLDLYAKGRLEAEFGEDGRRMKERIDREKGALAFDEKAPYLRKMLKRPQPRKAKERLTDETRAYLLEELGIRTDIDLRGPSEVWGMTESPLGPSARWLNYSSSSYGGMGTDAGKAAFAKVFRVFLDERNYPIDIHCIGGADRTGSDCYILNALLGVAEDDLAKDWEITCFEYESQDFGHARRFDRLLDALAACPGATARERCENYVKGLGFTDADIARFRDIMLEPKTPVTWKESELRAVPEAFPADAFLQGPLTNGVKAAFLSGLPFKGKATRFFAYWGVPENADEAHPVPAMVLVHGGGGSAFSQWVRFWVDRGYAAISMDLNGRVSGDLKDPSAPHPRHPWAGPGEVGCGGFELMNERPEDQWMYHAVAAVSRSYSFLRARPGVDPVRVGLTGVSWGGVVNCVVAAADDRFRFAAPVYGCGFLYETFSSWTHRSGGVDAKAIRPRREKWTPLWDPAHYLGAAKMPVHWLNGTNDGNFSLPSLERSFEAVPTEKSLSLRVRMNHCHGKVSEQAVELTTLADNVLRGGPALPKVGEPTVDGDVVSVGYAQDERLPATSATLDYTAEDNVGWWYSNRWESVSAKLSGGRATATVPKGAKWLYLSVRTQNGAVVSSRVLDLRK